MRVRPVLLLLPLLAAVGCHTVEAARAEAQAREAELAARSNVWVDEAQVTMSAYWVGVLRRGPAYTAEQTPEVRELLDRHLAYIDGLAQDGRLALAGPCGPQANSDPVLGLLVLRVATRPEAQALTDGDPAVQAGRLRVELVPWWAPKGITFTGLHHGGPARAQAGQSTDDDEALDDDDLLEDDSLREGGPRDARLRDEGPDEDDDVDDGAP